jgi:hypothetical protein
MLILFVVSVSTQTVACKVCGVEFKSNRALAAHMAKHKRGLSSGNPKNNPGDDVLELDTTLNIMRMLEEGHTPIEIMQIHKLSPQSMRGILQEYKELEALAKPEKPSSEAMLEIARLFGERIRDTCDSFNDEQGICSEFSLYDIDNEFRRMYPGLFKGSGGKTRFHVGANPWICCFCRKGIRRGGE